MKTTPEPSGLLKLIFAALLFGWAMTVVAFDTLYQRISVVETKQQQAVQEFNAHVSNNRERDNAAPGVAPASVIVP